MVSFYDGVTFSNIWLLNESSQNRYYLNGLNLDRFMGQTI